MNLFLILIFGALVAVSLSKGTDDCEFELDMCSWSQANKHSTYRWIRRSGKTPSCNTGPYGDATIQGGKGHYVYAEASRVKRGQVAKLQSKVYPGTPDGRCIEFAYSMYGWAIGALNVYVIDAKTGNQSNIFSKSGNQGKGWHRANANIVSNADYKISFEATRGYCFTADIALDNIIFKDGPCGPIVSKRGMALGVGFPLRSTKLFDA